MPHLRIGIVGDFQPRTALLLGLIMSKHRMDDVFIIARSDSRMPIDAGAIAIELIRTDIPAHEIRTLTLEHADMPEVSLKEALASIRFDEEFILPERESLPQPPKSIRPTVAAPRHRLIRRNFARNT